MDCDVTNNITFDEQLAEYTDALLNSKSPSIPVSLEEEAHIVRLLNRIIAPDESISPSFQGNLSSQLEAEFARRRPPKRSKRPPFRLTYRLAAAAAFVLVVAAIVLVTFGNNSNELFGLADGSIGVIFALFGVTLAGVLIFWITCTNRR